jgi:NAD+ synthase (glutamine-hydrolysing)
MKLLRIALAQMNFTVGDITGNVSIIVQAIKQAKKVSSDIIAFPELAITGYPPEDLLLKHQFIQDNHAALSKVKKHVNGITAIVGFVDKKDALFNAAAILHNRKVVDIYHKKYLPNYGVFDEYRYFRPGMRVPVYKIGDAWIGVNICEDIWYPEGPSRSQADAGADVIININASPYHIGKGVFREKMLSKRASENNVVIVYVNTVGGQDELVFDGHSVVVDQAGRIVTRGKQFQSDLVFIDIELPDRQRGVQAAKRRRKGIKTTGETEVEQIDICKPRLSRKKRTVTYQPPKRIKKLMDALEEIYTALVLGTSDYVAKNRFKGVVIGMSGGIDSSLVASVAVDALGSENVTGLFMPSRYTSRESRVDSYALAENLNMNMKKVPIDRIFESYLESFKKEFKGMPVDTTEENIQARIRGNILMAYSNKFGWLVLATGNKSEMSVGYATLYGDMAGGFAVIKDVPKTRVYELCRWRNRKAGWEMIPKRMFLKEPSAELKPNQKDSDRLPPYPVLDPILKAYIEDDMSYREIMSDGFSENTVADVIRMIDRSEYKRRQSPPGIKITERAFGRDRRFPITNKYKGF